MTGRIRYPLRDETFDPAARKPGGSAARAPHRPRGSGAPEPNPSAQLPALAGPLVGDTELYRAAHQLHFDGASAEAVLAAWNRYLEAVPHGAFVLEARYNRALTQMRLGLHREAINSLLPFAQGEYGAYREREARALIEKLETP